MYLKFVNRHLWRPAKWRLLTAAVLLFLMHGITLAAEPVRATGEYRLAADDVVSVTVLRHPEMSVEEATVTTSGKIQVPVAGEIDVVGKTLPQVEASVKAKLKRTLRNPQVTVALRRARARRVFVLGAVHKPGVYEIKPGWRVSEALAMAGGLTVRPDLVDGVLNRASRPPVPLQLQQLLDNSNGQQNLILEPDDVMRFVERIVTIQVNIVGQVSKSGSLTLPTGAKIIEAVAAAGGALPTAALRSTTIKRTDGTQSTVDLYEAIALGQEAPDFVLQEGDLITIPESKARVTVLGAVQKPGFYDIREGSELRLSEAVALAGGVTPKAALTRATLRRSDGSSIAVDLYQLQVLGQRGENIVLRDGDVITVPESRGITILGDVARPGTYYMEGGTAPRVADALALAGGLTIKPEASRISIARFSDVTAEGAPLRDQSTPVLTKTQEPAPATPDGVIEPPVSQSALPQRTSVDPVTLLELRDLSQNPRIYEGDLISVSAIQSPTVSITGEVLKPGTYELKEGDSVPELIARAGGPTPLSALTRVTVTEKKGTSQIVDVAAAVRDGGGRPYLPLQEGDFVVVPVNRARVYVMSAVHKPGYYPIPENEVLTVGEAISLAGGPKDRAKVKQIAVLRQTPKGVQREVFSLDKEYNGRLAFNQPLQNGDVVFVPEGRQSPSFWDIITRTVSSIGVLGNAFF